MGWMLFGEPMGAFPIATHIRKVRSKKSRFWEIKLVDLIYCFYGVIGPPFIEILLSNRCHVEHTDAHTDTQRVSLVLAGSLEGKNRH